jgi:iron complex transport system permease protein
VTALGWTAGAETVAAVRRTRRRRQRRVVLVLTAFALALAAVSVSVGAYHVSIPDLLRALLGQGEGREDFVVMQLRLPRLLMAVLVGLAFALSGALLQSVLDNALASPDIIGISGGASVAAVYAITILGLGGAAVSLSAFVGAAAVALVVYVLSWRRGVTGYRFVLTGIAVAYMAGSALAYMLTRSEIRDAETAMVWMIGSLNSVRWDEIVVIAAALAFLLPVTAALAGRLRALQLGDETAIGLGLRAERVRLCVLGTSAALAAVATAAAGPIAFVAFVSAPIARRLVGSDALALVPAALVGVVVVTASDFVALHLLPGNTQVPVGVITGAVGAPYLLWLLARTSRASGSA